MGEFHWPASKEADYSLHVVPISVKQTANPAHFNWHFQYFEALNFEEQEQEVSGTALQG